MRLKIFDRVILVILLLALIAFSCVVVLATWDIGLKSVNFTSYIFALMSQNVLNKVIISIAGFFIVFFCIRILFVREKKPEAPRQAPGILIRSGDNGSSYLTNAALEGMVLKHVKANPKVRECQCMIVPGRDFVSISLRLILTADTSLPEITQELQTSLKEHIEQMTGIQVRDVQIMVESAPANASQNLPARPRVE